MTAEGPVWPEGQAEGPFYQLEELKSDLKDRQQGALVAAKWWQDENNI